MSKVKETKRAARMSDAAVQAKTGRAWRDEDAHSRWLPGIALTIRKATPGQSMRITRPDGKSSVEVNFYAKGDGKSQVTVQHSKLLDAETAAPMKAYWAETLTRLQGTLEA